MRSSFGALVITVALAGCDGTASCIRGSTQECACSGGARGVQVCGSDGAFGICACDVTLDGGLPADAASSCDGRVCDAPPPPECADASTLTRYAETGTCVGGACSYAPIEVPCASGCEAGACVGEPCAGVVCNAPPPPECADASTLTRYAETGTCVGGACSYPPTDTPCVSGCADGACVGGPPVVVSLETSAESLSDLESVTLTAVVDDPEGVGTIRAGSVVDPASGALVAPFTIVSADTYVATFGWGPLHAARDITFLTEEPRELEARFFDDDGREGSRRISIVLHCPDPWEPGAMRSACGGACNGERDCGTGCVGLWGDHDHCGACGNACIDGTGWASCEAGTCACPHDDLSCGARGCRSPLEQTSCGSCGTSCSAAQRCTTSGCAAAFEGDHRISSERFIERFSAGSWSPVCLTEAEMESGVLDVLDVCRELGGDVSSAGYSWVDSPGACPSSRSFRLRLTCHYR